MRRKEREKNCQTLAQIPPPGALLVDLVLVVVCTFVVFVVWPKEMTDNQAAANFVRYVETSRLTRQCHLLSLVTVSSLVLAAITATRDDPHHAKVLLELRPWSCSVHTIGVALVTSGPGTVSCSELCLQLLVPVVLRRDQLLQMADVVDRLSKDDSLVGLVGAVDIDLGEQC